MKINSTLTSNALGSATAVGASASWALTSCVTVAPRYAPALEQISARVPAPVHVMAAKRDRGQLTFGPRALRTTCDPPV